jgi:hypothetical protein
MEQSWRYTSPSIRRMATWSDEANATLLIFVSATCLSDWLYIRMGQHYTLCWPTQQPNVFKFSQFTIPCADIPIDLQPVEVAPTAHSELWQVTTPQRTLANSHTTSNIHHSNLCRLCQHSRTIGYGSLATHHNVCWSIYVMWCVDPRRERKIGAVGPALHRRFLVRMDAQ